MRFADPIENSLRKSTQTVKISALLSLTLISFSCVTKPNDEALIYSAKINKAQRFLVHSDKAPMKSYLAMNLDFEVLASLRKQIEGELHISLKNRSEGHITVVSPVEFEQVLSSKLNMTEISAIAEKMQIQNTSFKPVCVGRGNLTLAGRDEQTYYIVVQSEGLFKIRQAIQRAFVAKGGSPSLFEPELFYPHATIGYTNRDLHYEDGIIKDERSCIFKIREQK